MASDTDASSTDAATAKRPARWSRRRLLAVAVAVVLVGVVGLATAVYTERPRFCPVCHEMGPYYDAWVVGPHNEISCVACHVDPGIVNHGLHKFVALGEVWDHFTRENLFPNYGVELPNARCVACHATVKDVLGAKFSHTVHAGKAPCKDCHTTAGHTVTLAALDKAGILKPAATDPPTPGGASPSAAAGHIKVTCQNCHDQAKMKCSQCHKATHEVKPGECSDCHVAGTRFLFKHPADAACEKCHKPPANHYGGACATCHSVGVPFANAVFRHTGNTGDHSYRSFPCSKCHPKGYASSNCTCHGGRPPRGD